MSKLSDFIEELLSKKTRVALRDLVNEIKNQRAIIEELVMSELFKLELAGKVKLTKVRIGNSVCKYVSKV